MNSQQPLRAPRVCQALVRVASWIAPAHARSEWRSRWDANLWGWWILYERGELTTRDHADLLRYSWGSFKDAFWLRISRENLKRSFRSASFVAAAGAMALLLMAAATHGFKGTQSLFAPLPVSDPDSLVLIQYTGAANEPFGVPPRLIPLWQAKARSLSGVAGYIGPARSPQATVTANFFSVLGVRPAIGRVFSQGEKDVAVLSGNAWHTMFNRDPGVIGKTVEISGSPFRIIGVLPESFWAISRGIDVWTPLDLESPGQRMPFLIGAVGRLKRGVSKEALRTELFETARAARQFLPRRPHVTTFSRIPSSAFKPYLFAALFAMVCGGVLVFRGLPLPLGHGWRYWSYLFVKVLLAFSLPTLAWVELSRRTWPVTLPEPARSLVLVVAPALIYIGICAYSTWWSFADQRRRCPVCLQLLSMPVTVGSWSSVLDPAQTEFFCDSGHGTLCLPETVDGQPDRWTNLDPSWSELFGANRRRDE